MYDILAEESLVAYLCHHVFPVLVEYDDFGEVGAVADVFRIVLLLEIYPDEPVFHVGVQLGIVVHDACRGNGFEADNLGLAWISFPVFLLEAAEICNGILRKMFKMIGYFIYLGLEALQPVFKCLDIKPRYLAHRLFHKPADVIHHYFFPDQVLIFPHLGKHGVKLGLPGRE